MFITDLQVGDFFSKISSSVATKDEKDRGLIKLIASSPNIGYSFVTDRLLCEWIQLFDPTYKPPSITKVKVGTFAIAAEMRTMIADLIQEADRVTICTDLWTAADGTHFLGIVAHFYCQSKCKPIRLIVGNKEITDSATASNIAKVIQDVWQRSFGRDLGGYRIANYVCDGGRNLCNCCNYDLPYLFAISAANERDEPELHFDGIEIG